MCYLLLAFRLRLTSGLKIPAESLSSHNTLLPRAEFPADPLTVANFPSFPLSLQITEDKSLPPESIAISLSSPAFIAQKTIKNPFVSFIFYFSLVCY